jgi:hypothetical protein
MSITLAAPSVGQLWPIALNTKTIEPCCTVVAPPDATKVGAHAAPGVAAVDLELGHDVRVAAGDQR